MITRGKVNDAIRALAAKRSATVVDSDSSTAHLIFDVLQGFASFLRIPEMENIFSAVGGQSVASYAPGLGNYIYLCEADCASAEKKLAVAVGMLVHIDQINSLGAGQQVIDYLGSGDLRAKYTCDARAAQAYVMWLLTGEVPFDLQTVFVPILTDKEKEFANGYYTLLLQKIETGELPIKAAQEAHTWLREHAAGELKV